jgi:exo-1,4-beta-D-glucosaminidase
VGPQNLYPLDLRFEVTGGQSSDSSHTEFGIREVTSELDAKGHRLFHINGKNILIRGAGYTFDMLLRSSPERQEAELRYVRDMNLNAVRFEGKLEDDHFLELCDRMGILVMAGWCCCDHWEQWGSGTRKTTIAAESCAINCAAWRATPRSSTGSTAATIRRRPKSSRCIST